MRLASYNIQYGLGKDKRFDLGRIADAVRGADVIALQEVERFYKRSGFVDQAQELANLLSDYHWVYGPGLDVHTTMPGPDGHPVHRRRQFGNMLLSRTPILSTRNFPLPKYGTLTQFSLQRTALEGVVAVPSGAARIYSVHLTHLSDETRLPQIEALLAVHARAPVEGGAWCGERREELAEGPPPPMPREAIIMGDFNFPPTSPLYSRIVGPSSPDYGRMNNLDGFVDAWVAAGNREHDGVTCNSASLSAGHRIDYCYVSASLAPRVTRAWIDTKAEGSDHQPIWTEIDL